MAPPNSMPACRVCEQPLRAGEQSLCQPCFDRRIASLDSPATFNRVKTGPHELKAAASRAAANAYLAQTGPQSTGFRMNELYNNKSSRLNARKEASGRRMVGTAASPKPPPFSSGLKGATSSKRRACSMGWVVQFEREHHSLTVLRGVVHVNRTSSGVLEDTKKSIFDLWPRDEPDPNHWTAYAPSPPHIYVDRWFALARSGTSKKAPTLLHNAEVLESHLSGKGEPNLELIFLADQYYKDNPTIPRPGASFRATLQSTSRPTKSKRKSNHEPSTAELDLDQSFGVDNIFLKKQKTSMTPDSTPTPSNNQPKCLKYQPGELFHNPVIIASTSVATRPTLPSPLRNSVPLTVALPSQQTCKCLMYIMR